MIRTFTGAARTMKSEAILSLAFLKFMKADVLAENGHAFYAGHRWKAIKRVPGGWLCRRQRG